MEDRRARDAPPPCWNASNFFAQAKQLFLSLPSTHSFSHAHIMAPPSNNGKRKRPATASASSSAPAGKKRAHASRSKGARELKRSTEDEEIAGLDQRCRDFKAPEGLKRFDALPLSAKTLKGE